MHKDRKSAGIIFLRFIDNLLNLQFCAKPRFYVFMRISFFFTNLAHIYGKKMVARKNVHYIQI